MKTAITVAWGPSTFAPLVLRGDLDESFRIAAELGFDGVEVNGSIDDIDPRRLRVQLREHGLLHAALATGVSAVREGVGLSSSDPSLRNRAAGLLRSTIDVAAETGAVAVVGLVTGGLDSDPQAAAMGRTRALDALEELGAHAEQRGVRLGWEPINRYESTFVNTVADTLACMDRLSSRALDVLLDTFHMNIEERSIEDAIALAGQRIGYVQLSDSNRWAPGFGHLDFGKIVRAIRSTGYDGWVSAEVLPRPDPMSAAQQALRSFRSYWEGR